LKDTKVKQVLSVSGYQWEEKDKWRGKKGRIWRVYFAYVYENRTMKPVEIVLRSREGGSGRMMEEINLIKIYHKHICKCHNESPFII
jgi:hypothetical protein